MLSDGGSEQNVKETRIGQGLSTASTRDDDGGNGGGDCLEKRGQSEIEKRR